MAFCQGIMSRALECIEIKNLERCLVDNNEQVPTMREANLTTALDRNTFHVDQICGKHVHHENFLNEADNYMETRRMESDR